MVRERTARGCVAAKVATMTPPMESMESDVVCETTWLFGEGEVRVIQRTPNQVNRLSLRQLEEKLCHLTCKVSWGVRRSVARAVASSIVVKTEDPTSMLRNEVSREKTEARRRTRKAVHSESGKPIARV